MNLQEKIKNLVDKYDFSFYFSFLKGESYANFVYDSYTFVTTKDMLENNYDVVTKIIEDSYKSYLDHRQEIYLLFKEEK